MIDRIQIVALSVSIVLLLVVFIFVRIRRLVRLLQSLLGGGFRFRQLITGGAFSRLVMCDSLRTQRTAFLVVLEITNAAEVNMRPRHYLRLTRSLQRFFEIIACAINISIQ